MRLAAALLDVGNAEEAAQQYESCLKGPFANDPEIRFGAARALTESQHFSEACRHLESLRKERPAFRPEAVALLLARCYAGTSREAEARSELEAAESRFGTFQAKAEYAIWALAIGDKQTANRLDEELQKLASRWNSLARDLNASVYRRYRAARDVASKRT
jgi:hypothetical protein